MPSATSRLASVHLPEAGVHRAEHRVLDEARRRALLQLGQDAAHRVALTASRVNRRQLGQDARMPPRHRERVVRRGDRLVVPAERRQHPHHRPPSGERVVVELHRRARRIERLVQPPDARETERLDRRRPTIQRIELPRRSRSRSALGDPIR